MENKYKYKLKICDFYMKGKCNKQDECTYAHGEKELLCVFDENCLDDNIYIKNKENKESFKKVDIFDEKEFPIFNNNTNPKKDISDTNNITYDLKKILNIKDEYKYIKKEKEKFEFNIQKIDNNINENIEIINKMYNEILKLNMEIKQNIKKYIKNDYLKFIFINDLNKIESNIKIFKDNYEDCLK